VSDDRWDRERAADNPGAESWDDLGDPVFADDGGDAVALSFGPDDTGPLPHWTAPPTGEIPRIFADKDPTEDLDVWSSFAQQAPVWRDEDRSEPTSMFDTVPEAPAGTPTRLELEPLFEEPVDGSAALPLPDEPRPKVREPIRIGVDSTGGTTRTGRPGGPGRPGRPGDEVRGSRAANRATPAGGTAGRDMPTAIALGLGLAAVFVALVKFLGSTGIMALVVAVLGLAAVEFYEKTQERGYRPATVTGVLACVLLPLAAYWRGETGIVVGLFLATVATMITMMGFSNVEAGPLPNAAITLLGIVWIGAMGSFAGLLLSGPLGEPRGTDTIFALVIAVVANDVGALVVGSAGGRTPLRPWISPNKTLEGLIGGTVASIGSMLLLKIANGEADTWISGWHYVLFGLVVALLAPIGDLTESMFKRNLDIKDFGTILPGHGGILDRFDGFLFTLPAAYYLLVVLEPWTKAPL
jgi:phosphatidate cytidylyltransferase